MERLKEEEFATVGRRTPGERSDVQPKRQRKRKKLQNFKKRMKSFDV